MCLCYSMRACEAAVGMHDFVRGEPSLCCLYVAVSPLTAVGIHRICAITTKHETATQHTSFISFIDLGPALREGERCILVVKA